MQQNVLPAQGKVVYLDAVEVAIQREIKAKFMYEMMAKHVKDAHMQKKLLFLAEEEQSHRVSLEDLYKKISGSTKDFASGVDYPSEESAKKLANIEMKEVLKIAIGKETEAHQLYVELAAQAEHSAFKEIFNYLAEEELTHRRMLELQLKLYTGERPQANEASVEMVPGVYKEWW